MKHSVLLDTSFLIRLLNEDDPLHLNAVGYYRYFLDQDIELCISTISIAEYCVVGDLTDLPLKTCRIIPFNINHAERTGTLAKVLFSEKENHNIEPRPIIPNDSKLFSQADSILTVKYFVTSDSRSKKNYKILVEKLKVNFEIIDIHQSFSEVFGILPL